MYADKVYPKHIHRHILSILVHDEPGVLTRISSLFFKRNFNINTLTVGPSATKGISRITISFFGDDRVYEQLVKQLNKLIDVLKVSDLLPHDSVIRDLCLIRIKTKDVRDQNQVMNYCHAYRARIVDISPEEVIVEMLGKPEKIDAFLEIVKPMGVKELARTGVTAMARGGN